MPSVPGSSAFPIVFVVLAALIALVFLIVIVTVARNIRKVRRAGHDPFTLQADLATRLMDSELLSAERPVQARLTELDSLREQNLITTQEYAEARSAVLRAV